MSQFPDHLKYTATHEWVDEHAGEATIGITDHAQELLGDLVFIELPQIGQEVAAGDEIGVLESVKAASDYYAPISGVVTAVNQDLTSNPERLNQDPYGEAWLVKIEMNDPEELQELLTSSEYSETIDEDH